MKEFPQVLLSDEQVKLRKMAAAHVSCVYEVRFMVKGDGPFASQSMQLGAATEIADVLKKGGASQVSIYEVRERHAVHEYVEVNPDKIAK